MSECGKYVELTGGVSAYPCTLEPGHDGPHLAVEVPASQRQRDAWHRENAAKTSEEKSPRQVLDDFQGEALTTAQRYTENPTPHPDITPAPEPEVSDEVKRVAEAMRNEISSSKVLDVIRLARIATDTYRESKPSGTGMVTVKDAAERFGVSPARIYTLISEGKVNATKVGRGYKMALSDLLAYFEGGQDA